MNTLVLERTTFGFIVATRAALGLGVGLLIAQRLSPERRRTIGTTLVTLGAVTTIPAVLAVIRGARTPKLIAGR